MPTSILSSYLRERDSQYETSTPTYQKDLTEEENSTEDETGDLSAPPDQEMEELDNTDFVKVISWI